MSTALGMDERFCPEQAFVDEGYTGEKAAQAADGEDIRLEAIKLPDVKKGFVLRPAAG
jgi:hypothetical protein